MFIVSIQRALVSGFRFNSSGKPIAIEVFKDHNGLAMSIKEEDFESFSDAANRYMAIRDGLEVEDEGVYYCYKKIEYIGKTDWVKLDESKSLSLKSMIIAHRRGKALGFFL